MVSISWNKTARVQEPISLFTLWRLVNGRFVYSYCFHFLMSYPFFILLHSSFHPHHFTGNVFSKITNSLVANSSGKHFGLHLVWLICSIWHWLIAFILWHYICLVFLLLLWQSFLSLLQRPFFSWPIYSSGVFQDSVLDLPTLCNSLGDFFHSHYFNSIYIWAHLRSVCAELNGWDLFS